MQFTSLVAAQPSLETDEKLELRTLQEKRLQNSEAAIYESFISFVRGPRVKIVTLRESRAVRR
jgi:hypothetical protein